MSDGFSALVMGRHAADALLGTRCVAEALGAFCRIRDAVDVELKTTAPGDELEATALRLHGICEALTRAVGKVDELGTGNAERGMKGAGG